MAGATNRAFKAAGIPKSAIKELRVTGGRGLTLRSAISLAGERGIAIPDKAKAHLAARDRKAASSPEGQAAASDFRAKAAAGLKSMAERKAALQAARQQRVGKAMGDAMKIARGMRQKQAADAAQKAAAPDPHAETRARIARLEGHLARGKQMNKIIRAEEKKGGDGWEQRAAARILSEKLVGNEALAHKMVKPDFAGRRGMPNYEFTNQGATIRRLKDQIGVDRKKGVSGTAKVIERLRREDAMASQAASAAAGQAKQAQIGRTARAIGDASKIARGMRQKKAADAQAAKAKEIDSIRSAYREAARGYINDLKEASGRRKGWDGPLVHLQTIGKTPAKKAGELKTGDTLVFNGGATAKVTKVEPLSRTYMTVTTDSGYTRKYGRERLVAFDPR